MIYFLLLILVLANRFFMIIPDGQIAGGVKPADVGLLLLLAGVLWSFSKPQTVNRCRDPIAISIFILLIMLMIQSSMASFNFGQSVVNGLIAIREQYYYLSFFLFLAVLNTEEKMKRFLDRLSILAIIVAAIAILHRIFGGIYQSAYFEQVVFRSGIVRGNVAGMDIITLSLLWQTAKLTAKKSESYSSKKYGLTAAFFLGIHFFRQTRSRLVSVLVVLGWLLYKNKQKKLLFSGLAAIIFAALIAEVAFDENIVINPFISTADVAQDTEGLQSGRFEQMTTDFEIFLEHPILGSGSSALRASEASNIANASEIATKMDLGYTHWLKAYGLQGVLWLLWFYFLLWARIKRILKCTDTDKSALPIFMLSNFYYIVISFVTLNHFMIGYGIMLVCALAAMAVNLSHLNSQKTIV